MVAISQAFPAGSIASGTGIKTNNAQFAQLPSVLPVSIALLGQHATGVLPAANGFEYDKPRTITSAEDAADIFGFGSPIHIAARVLYNSKQSIANILLDVFPIKESDTGKSKGTLTLDVNPTDADTMTVDSKVYTFEATLTNVDGNILIGATKEATQANIVAAFDLSGQPGIQYAAAMTAHPTVDIAAFVADNSILTAKNSGVAGDTIVTTETFTGVTNVFDAATLGTTQAGANTTSAGSVAFVGTQTQNANYTLTIGSERIPFTLVKDTTATEAATLVKALIDGLARLPVTAGTIAADSIPLTARWAGITGDEIGIEISGLFQGIAITPTAMSGGAGSPTVAGALENFQERYTVVINQFDDAANLNALEVKNEVFWTALESRPFVAYYGSKETDATLVIVDTDARLNERTNSKFPIPGSPSVHIEIASSAAAVVAITSNGNPPKPYYEAIVFGVLPGDASVVQWTYAERDLINKGGSSTSFFDDGVIRIGDLLTTFHPAGVENPGFRYNVDISKLQLILTDLRKLFQGEKWQGKILVPDDAAVTNPEARKPNSAKGHVFGLIDVWGELAVIADVEFSKDNTQTEIDPTNANRLNVVVPVILSGAARIRSIDLEFSTEVTGA